MSFFAQDGWILACFFFLRVYGPRLRLGPDKHAKKKELGQYPAIFTSRLVSYSYILPARDSLLCIPQQISVLLHFP